MLIFLTTYYKLRICVIEILAESHSFSHGECQRTLFSFPLQANESPEDNSLYLPLQISCVVVPIGQNTHHERGLYSIIVIKPITVDVNITL